jgi:hypothetical protein
VSYPAHGVVQRAVRDGLLVRQPCEKCGAGQAHAHHDNYDEPMNVMWLCAKHHRARHRELGWGVRPILREDEKRVFVHLSLPPDAAAALRTFQRRGGISSATERWPGWRAKAGGVHAGVTR